MVADSHSSFFALLADGARRDRRRAQLEMITFNARIFVATQPVDFRGSFGRLGGIVRERLAQDPRSGTFFVFFNRGFDRRKILFFDKTGDCIFYKRLDQGTFRGIIDLDPEQERVEIDGEKLRALLVGLLEPRGPKKLH
jgi:transposase